MIHFIVNEASGRGRAAAMWREMRRALLTAGVPIAPDASANDGLLSICLAHGLTRPQVFTKLPRLACGKHTHCNGVNLFTASAIDVRLSQPMVVHADGEVPGRVRHATFKVLPQKLRVLV